MKKLFLFAALFVAAAFSSCSKHDDVKSLAIAFTEGHSLQFDIGETKTVHYTITGGSSKTVVKAEMQTPDDAYTVETVPTSAAQGTITITVKTLSTDNCVLVTASDGSQTIMASIDVIVILKASFDGQTVVVETPGTLAELLADYDESSVCTKLTVIGNLNDEDIATLNNLPNLAILDMEHANLEMLPSEAFRNKTSLTSVKLPKTLKTIGDYAFCWCRSLTRITIPDSVTSIGSYAFYNCSNLTGVYITDIAKWCAIKFTNYDSNPLSYAHNLYLNGELVTELVTPDGVTSIGAYAFSECTSLTSITVPDSVTTIGEWAFFNCSSLTSITIGNSVTSIGVAAFAYCRSLTSITIPDSVTEIGSVAFHSCSSLTSVTIGNSVTSIGEGAFYDCSSLTSIYCKVQTPPTIVNTTFNRVATSTPLYVPIGSTDTYRAAEYWSEFTNINEMEF